MRKRSLEILLFIWVIATFLAFLLVGAQSAEGKYGPDVKDVWSWLISATAPNVSLLLTAALMDSHKVWGSRSASVSRFFIALGFSVILVTLLYTTLLIEPLVGKTWQELIELAELPIAVVQGLTVASVSAVIFEGR